MAHRQRQSVTLALTPEMNTALTCAAKARGVSRSEFVRQQLALVLEQFRDHPKPRCAGILRRKLPERGDEDQLFKDLER